MITKLDASTKTRSTWAWLADVIWTALYTEKTIMLLFVQIIKTVRCDLIVQPFDFFAVNKAVLIYLYGLCKGLCIIDFVDATFILYGCLYKNTYINLVHFIFLIS